MVLISPNIIKHKQCKNMKQMIYYLINTYIYNDWQFAHSTQYVEPYA